MPQGLRHRNAASRVGQTSLEMAVSDADSTSDSEQDPNERQVWRNAEGETLKDFGVDPEDDNDYKTPRTISTTGPKRE